MRIRGKKIWDEKRRIKGINEGDGAQGGKRVRLAGEFFWF